MRAAHTKDVGILLAAAAREGAAFEQGEFDAASDPLGLGGRGNWRRPWLPQRAVHRHCSSACWSEAQPRCRTRTVPSAERDARVKLAKASDPGRRQALAAVAAVSGGGGDPNPNPDPKFNQP